MVSAVVLATIKLRVITEIILWRSISMRAGPASLQFEWSKAGLSVDLPVFAYSHTKTSFKFLSRQEGIGQLFMWLEIFYFKARRENLTGLLFCLDLSLSRSTDNRDRNLHSLSHRFQPSCSWVMQLGILYFVFLFECKHVKSHSVS